MAILDNQVPVGKNVRLYTTHKIQFQEGLGNMHSNSKVIEKIFMTLGEVFLNTIQNIRQKIKTEKR